MAMGDLYVQVRGPGVSHPGVLVGDLGCLLQTWGVFCLPPGGLTPWVAAGAVGRVSPWVTSWVAPRGVQAAWWCVSRGVLALCGCCPPTGLLLGVWQPQHLAGLLPTGEEGWVLPGHPPVLLLAQLLPHLHHPLCTVVQLSTMRMLLL